MYFRVVLGSKQKNLSPPQKKTPEVQCFLFIIALFYICIASPIISISHPDGNLLLNF